MALSDDYRPRLSIVLTELQRKRLSKVLPWGTGRVLFSSIVDEIIELLEHHGMAAVGLIVSKKATLLELMMMKEEASPSPVTQYIKDRRSFDAVGRPQTLDLKSEPARSNSLDSGNKTESKAKQKAGRKAKKD